MKIKYLGLLLVLLLTSCSILSPVKTPPKKTYLLTDPLLQKNTQNKSQQILLVSQVTATPWLSTNKMAYQLTPNEIDYFAQNQWAAQPSELLEPIIVHALQNSGNYKAVVSAPFVGSFDQVLDIQLLSMQQMFTQKPSFYHIIIQARLINNTTQKVLASQRFEFNQAAPTDDPTGGVTAANQAVQLFIPKLIKFIHVHQNT